MLKKYVSIYNWIVKAQGQGYKLTSTNIINQYGVDRVLDISKTRSPKHISYIELKLVRLELLA